VSTPKVIEVNSANLGTLQVLHRDCPLCGRDNSDQPDNVYSYDGWAIKDGPASGFTYIDKGQHYPKLLEEPSWETDNDR